MPEGCRCARRCTEHDPHSLNYYVPFTDYVKNVACNEIYSTWPVEAIEANCTCNYLIYNEPRVYRNGTAARGYNFTITSSTAYDQEFTYGRNIFAEISNIVDYLFTTFIISRTSAAAAHLNTATERYNLPRVAQPMGVKGAQRPRIRRRADTAHLLRMGHIFGRGRKEFRVSRFPYGPPSGRLGRAECARTIQERLNAISDNYPANRKSGSTASSASKRAMLS